MTREELLKVWGYMDILCRQFQEKAQTAAENMTIDAERRNRLISDYNKFAAEISDLQIKLQAEADRAQE